MYDLRLEDDEWRLYEDDREICRLEYNTPSELAELLEIIIGRKFKRVKFVLLENKLFSIVRIYWR